MPHMDIDLVNDVDTVKAFGIIVLGSVLAGLLVYMYRSSVKPAITGLLPSAATPATGTASTQTT